MKGSLGKHLGTSRSQDFVLLAALALGGYIVYQIVQGVKKTSETIGAAVDQFNQLATTAGESATSAIAKVYAAATLPPPIHPTGSVNLQPSGLILPTAQISPMVFDASDNQAYFVYQNALYSVAPGAVDAQGNYLAQIVPDMPDWGNTTQTGWD